MEFEMSLNNQETEYKTMKCPNPKCGIELQSPYHTICPLCAEPFPINMLNKEKQQAQPIKLIVLILLLLGFSTLIAYLLSM